MENHNDEEEGRDYTATAVIKPSRFRELRGAFFRRISPEAIEIWRETQCYSCFQPISVSRFACTCHDDREPLWAKLRQVERDPASPGYSMVSGGMQVCGLCAQGWRESSPLRPAELGVPFE